MPESVPGCPADAPYGSTHWTSCIPSQPENRAVLIGANANRHGFTSSQGHGPYNRNYQFRLPNDFTCDHCNMQW